MQSGGENAKGELYLYIYTCRFGPGSCHVVHCEGISLYNCYLKAKFPHQLYRQALCVRMRVQGAVASQ